MAYKLLFCMLVIIGAGAKSTLREELLGSYPRSELKARLGLYRKSRGVVLSHNADKSRHYDMEINKFSTMTKEERQQYLGIKNATFDLGEEESPALSSYSVPDSIDHTDLGHVTKVKNQESCGSCWAFAAVGSFEGSYSTVTGVKKSFSEKEILDCSYKDEKDGCKGGYYYSAFQYMKTSQRLATMIDGPYWPEDGPCVWGDKPNGIKNAVFLKHIRIRRDATSLQRATAHFTPAIAYTVEDSLYLYKSGVYDGCVVHTTLVDHASVMVGYTQQWWKVKNSWGPEWGEGGFVRFTREKHNVCNIVSHAVYPIVMYKDRGEKDEGDDDVTPDDKLVNVALGAKVDVSPLVWGDGSLAVDGDTSTHHERCFNTGMAANPHVAVDLKGTYTIEKIVLITPPTSAKGMKGSKLYIGHRGNFMDERVAVLESHVKGIYSVRARSHTGARIDASKVYLEYYNYGQTQRSLELCEIQVWAKQESDD